jgi:hypothetical protein
MDAFATFTRDTLWFKSMRYVDYESMSWILLDGNEGRYLSAVVTMINFRFRNTADYFIFIS